MNGSSVSLAEKRIELVKCAIKAFKLFAGLPKSVRPDDKARTGIRVLVREIGTRNIIFFSVGEPSEQAIFFAAEKAARSEVLGHLTSQQSEDPDEMKYRGSVAFMHNTKIYQASVSGLTADDDVAIAIKMLSVVTGKPSWNICRIIVDSNGHLPACFEEEGNYLYNFIKDN